MSPLTNVLFSNSFESEGLTNHLHDLVASLPEFESTCSVAILLSESSSARVRQCAPPAPEGDEMPLALALQLPFDFCGFPRFLQHMTIADQLLTVSL